MGEVIWLWKGDDRSGMSTIFDVAEYFLSIQSMTHKKLQKLCFYAQAWHLALLHGPLFGSRFEAWVHGPVSPELYQRYREYGWDEIPACTEFKGSLDPQSRELIDAVYETYGPFDGDQLEAISHTESPWCDARAGLQEWEPSHNVITEDAMQQHYRAKYEQSQND